MSASAASARIGHARMGFTLVELLIATAITVVALSLAVALLRPASAAFQALPEAIDNQQRLRIATTAIGNDIAAAGAGPILGWGASTVVTWPPVLPCRWTGGPLASTPGGCARDDAITVMAVEAEAPAVIVSERSGTTAPLRVGPISACDPVRAACRLDVGIRALLIDGTGAWDVFTVTGVSEDGTEIGHAQDVLSRAAIPGALIAAVVVRSYSLKPDASTGIMQLRRGSGGTSDAPVADQITGLSFAYVAAAAPPEVIAGTAPAFRAATYGPLPPPPEIDNPDDAWPAGENCVFRLEGTRQVPRLAALTPDEHGLALLPLAALADGPWCPDEGSANRWDADLLRIRLVRVSLRVQPQSPAVRGAPAAPNDRSLPVDVLRWVPDLEVRFDVVLRSQSR